MVLSNAWAGSLPTLYPRVLVMAGSILSLRKPQVRIDITRLVDRRARANSKTEDAQKIDKKARIWGKHAIERESNVLGDTDPSSVLPADFIIPFENIYKDKTPPMLNIE